MIQQLLVLAAATTAVFAGNDGVSMKVLTQKNVSFERVGRLYAGSDYGHIYAVVDLNEVVATVNRLTGSLDEAQDKVLKISELRGRVEVIGYVNASFSQLREELSDVRHDLGYICLVVACRQRLETSRYEEAADKSKPAKKIRMNFGVPAWMKPGFGRRRKARQAAFALGLISAGVSIYNTYEIEMMKGRLSAVEHQSELIAAELLKEEHVVNELVDHVEAVEEDLLHVHEWQKKVEFELGFTRLTATLGAAAGKCRRYVDAAVEVVLHKEANLRFFDAAHLKAAVDEIVSKAGTSGFAPVSTSLNDVAAGHVSFQSDEGKIFFMLHVALGRLPAMNLYKYIDSPILLEKGKAVTVDVGNRHIALDPNLSERVELTGEELQHCVRIGDAFLCKNGVSSKSIASTCLGALYTGAASGIRKLCVFRPLQSVHETVTQVAPRVITIYTPPPAATSVYVTCRSQPPQQLLTEEYVELTLPADCEAVTSHFVFRPEFSLHLEERFIAKPLVLPEVTKELIAQAFGSDAQLDADEARLKGLPGLSHLNGTVDLTQFHPDHTAFYGVTGVILLMVMFVAALLAYIAFRVYREKARRKRRASKGSRAPADHGDFSMGCRNGPAASQPASNEQGAEASAQVPAPVVQPTSPVDAEKRKGE